MKWLVDAVRAFEIMRGTGVKCPADSEKTTRINNRKSVVLTRDVNSGEKLTHNDIAIKRPGYGIGPKYFEQLIGKVVYSDLAKDSVLTWNDLE
jgi:N,N'-diacetyllegionaminate synthase